MAVVKLKAMERIIDVLEEHILPVLRSGEYNIVPAWKAPLEQTSHQFFEAFHNNLPYGAWLWILNGAAHVRQAGKIYQLEAGDFYFLPPRTPCADIYHRDTVTYDTVWFINSPRRINFAMTHYRPFGQYSTSSAGSIPTNAEIGSALLALQREINLKPEYSRQAVDGILIQLTALFMRGIRGVQDAKPLHQNSVSARVMNYLDAHHDEDLTLSRIARSTRLSPNYLTAVFKQETGQTIFQELARIRIEHAMRLLTEERLPVHVVAAQVGYNNLDHFSRVFRRLKGAPPSRYGRYEAGRNSADAE